MNEDRTLQGIWFLPDKQPSAIGGVFSYSRKNGCRLELVDQSSDDTLNKKDVDILLGITSDGIPVTLLQCSRTSRSTNIKGVEIIKYRVQFALIGHHFLNKETILFDKLKASISDLGTWASIYGFSKLDVQQKEFIVDLKYKIPGDLHFPIPGNMKAGFEFDASSTWIKETERAEIDQKIFAVVVTAELIPLNALLSSFYTFYKFFSLLYYDAPPLLSLYLHNSTLKNELNEDYPFRVELLYSDNFYNANYKQEKIPPDFLFLYTDIESIFPTVIHQWFELFEKIGPAINLLNELLLKRGLPIEVQFLISIQAVETSHRNIFGGVMIPEDEHEKRMAAILASAPEEHKKWLKENLQFSNEPKLRKRLADLYERLPTEITERLMKDKKGIINDIVNTRNYYTHYDPSLKGRVMDFKKTFNAVQKLKVILISSVLNELGFAQDQVIQATKMHIVYPFLD